MFKNVVTIDVGDWDDLVQNTYGKIYSFQQQDDCKARGTEYVLADEEDDYQNDTVPEQVNHPDMGVSFKAWLARDVTQPLKDEADHTRWDLQLWWERNFYPSAGVIAADLYKRGLIPYKEFTIDIDW